MKKILFISGSQRKNSFNTQLINFLLEETKKYGLETEVLNYDNIDFFNQDIEFPTPENINLIREKIKSANALWISSPEYNGSYSGALKNLLDWISRPIEKGQFGAPDFIKDKAVALSGAAGGSKASRVLDSLTILLKAMKLNVFEEKVGMSIPAESWASDKLIINEEQKEEFRNQIKNFINFIEK